MNFLAAQLEVSFFVVHDDVAATGYTAGAHASGNNRCMGGHTAANGQDALCMVHAFNIFRRGLQTNQNDLLAFLAFFGSFLCGKDNLAAGSARGSSQTGANLFGSLECFGIKLWVQQSVQLFWLDHADRFFFGDHALVHQVAGNLDGSGSGSLAVAGLEHKQFAVFDGELHVLHISVMLFQTVCNVAELLIHFRHDVFQLIDVLWGSDAGYNVLALCVDQKFAQQLVFAGGRVTGEGYAGTGIVAGVAKYHGLYVDRSTPGGWNVIHSSVVDCAWVIPGTEYSFDSAHQLLFWVLREVCTNLLFIVGFKFDNHVLEVFCIQLGVQFNALCLFHLVDDDLKVVLWNLHYNVGVHLNEATVGVVGKTLILGQLCKAFHYLVVESQVEDGVHHARHGSSCTGADGNQQRIVDVSEFFAGKLFEFSEVFKDFSLDFRADLFAVFIILGACLGCNGEALWNRHTEYGHFCKVCAFAAEQFTHFCVSFRKRINKFLVQ